jgi:hypothetical protein
MLFLLLLSSFLMMSSGIDVSSMPFQAIIIREAEAASRIGHDPELNTENATGEVENAVERFEASDLEACEDEDESTLTTSGTVNSKPKASKPSKCTLRCPLAQIDFIEATRKSIKCNRCPDFKHDWRNIMPNKEVYGPKATKLDFDDLCIKPIASWVPHLLFDGHRPWTPPRLGGSKCQ